MIWMKTKTGTPFTEIKLRRILLISMKKLINFVRVTVEPKKQWNKKWLMLIL